MGGVLLLQVKESSGGRHRGRAREGRKEAAMHELRLAKLWEVQAEQSSAMLHTITAAQLSLSSAYEAQAQAGALQVARGALAALLAGMPDLDTLMAQVEEGMEDVDAAVAPLSAPLSLLTGMGMGGGEGDWERELAALLAEGEGAPVPTPVVHALPAPAPVAAPAPAPAPVPVPVPAARTPSESTFQKSMFF
jgi:hypothetical protein